MNRKAQAHSSSLLQPKLSWDSSDQVIRITKENAQTNIYALVFLHFPSPLASGAVQLNGKALVSQCSSILGRIKTQPTQRGVPANRAAHGVHHQRARKESRSVRIRLWSRLWWVL
jgi:hypothetical protein